MAQFAVFLNVGKVASISEDLICVNGENVLQLRVTSCDFKTYFVSVSLQVSLSVKRRVTFMVLMK